MPFVAVVTLVHGRHRHLRRQQRSLAAATRPPDLVVVAAMDDDRAAGVVNQGPLADRSRVLDVSKPSGASRGTGLPLAAARNRGAEAALAAGAELVVFLDVDCMVAPGALAAYERAWCRTEAPALLCGPVAYLDPPADGHDYTAEDLATAAPHPGRPAPDPGVVEPADDHRLFWSLSFALDAGTWRGLDGFDEAYVGYGGEDTDFGQRARAADVPMYWVGGARAYHQWHPVSDPPWHHVSDIVRNANLFAQRWGWWPMETWLEQFEQAGRVARSDAGTWHVCDTASDRGTSASAPAP